MPQALSTLFEREGLPSSPLPQALRERYGGGGDLGFSPGTVYANFVTSLDGVAALDPKTPPSVVSAKNDMDRFVMGLLRAFRTEARVDPCAYLSEPVEAVRRTANRPRARP